MIGLRWGRITEINPLRVQLDGDSMALPISIVSLCRPKPGDRVAIGVVGTMRIILGVIGGDIPPDNYTIIDGKAYQLSGTSGPPPISYVQSYAPVYVARGSIPAPYVPPAGYGFDVYALESTGYTVVSVHEQSVTSISLNVIQVGSSQESALERVGWRLTKL